jgi:hypothetical protein
MFAAVLLHGSTGVAPLQATSYLRAAWITAVPLSTCQSAQLVAKWAPNVGLRLKDHGTHSMGRARAAIIYRAPGNLPGVQILLGDPKIQNIVRLSSLTWRTRSFSIERKEI